MNSKEYKELIQVYQNVYEQQIGVPLDKPTDGAAARKLQQMIPKGEKVYIPKSGLQKAHYEPEGQQLQEKPGDGYLGPTPIPNPIRLAKDTVDATNRATQRRVDAVNKIQPGSASMPKVNYFNKGPSAASQKYLGLKNEQNQGPSTPVKIDPKMGVVPNQGAGRVGAVRLKPGTPTSSLIKPVDEQQVINPPKSGGLEFPFRSVDGLIRGGAASGIPDIPDNIKRRKQNMDMLKQGMVKKQTPKPTTQLAHLDLFDIVKGYLISEGYADNAKAASAIVENMSEDWLDIILEDLEERRKKLVQRQREQVAAAQERVASHQQARRKKRQKAQEKEQIKNELRKEIRREAVGDPISPNSVFKLSDPVHQKNIRSAATPAGPPPMKPTAPKPKQQSNTDMFVKRMVGSTMLSPL